MASTLIRIAISVYLTASSVRVSVRVAAAFAGDVNFEKIYSAVEEARCYAMSRRRETLKSNLSVVPDLYVSR